ncbi:MAG: endoribonuclease [Symploca sp. SIO1C4]|uniref:Endoribonuclease n=1 Tax=Symploca sp. SIO1C4 TaxID=2607765 RepID=A0A6B3NGD2_9CYAN|nr:endoribonuclease [Symploca sp. SIO1C4]
MSHTDIYQQIWESDENQFSVSARNSSGDWEDKNADILLDEQVKASGKPGIDLATRPLFYKVNEDKLFDKKLTYVNFIQLLDNYTIRTLDPEFTPDQEEQEQRDFINLIISTKPIQITLEYINQELGANLSQIQFKAKLQRIWFELYTNYYNGKSTHFASGFEHVFVGEGKFNIRSGNNLDNLGTISGYHSWVKFYLDEQNQRVNFLGYKYDLKGKAGSNNPNVVTLQMLQDVTDMRGNIIAQLFKKKGGFFVGPSPECEIAMATVAYFQSIDGLIRDRQRISINDANYNLVLYRSTNPNGSRGEFIRSFFPIFLGNDGVKEPEMNRPEIVPIDNIIKNDGSVVIVAALPNPEGSDTGGREWVELKNVTNSPINLTGWEMQDKMGRPESLSGTLEPNEVKRFPVRRSSNSSMQMTNKSGLIAVFDNQLQQVATVKYSRANSGEIIQFTN